MQNTNPDRNKNPNPEENKEKLNKKIKKTWTALSNEDIELYEQSREDFFAKFEEKEDVSQEVAQEELQQLDEKCGCSRAAKAV